MLCLMSNKYKHKLFNIFMFLLFCFLWMFNDEA